MGNRGFHFCLLHTVIAIWRGIFWLKWQGKKVVQKRPVGGTKCVKYTNNVNKGAWLFFPIEKKIKNLMRTKFVKNIENSHLK